MHHISTALTKHPAHLWIADEQTLQHQTVTALQNIFCKLSSCGQCLTCTQIALKQHHNIYWIDPENNYTLDFINQVLDNTHFQLESDEYRFFIFNKTETFNTHCNNRLLKTIEEPNQGYIFILLSTNTQNILPTVISRCLVKEFSTQFVNEIFDNFIQLLLQASVNHTLNFLKMLEQFEIKEQETKTILDLMMQHIHTQLINIHAQPNHDIAQMIRMTNIMALIKQALQQAPAPGSAKIFWKNFYLQLICANHV